MSPVYRIKKLASLGQDLLLLLPHLHRVHAVFLGNFVQHLQAAGGFEPEFCLQVSAWNLSFLHFPNCQFFIISATA
jgi:hypothetical protein